VGSHINALGEYKINDNEEQCLALALPYPGVRDGKKTGIV